MIKQQPEGGRQSDIDIHGAHARTAGVIEMAIPPICPGWIMLSAATFAASFPTSGGEIPPSFHRFSTRSSPPPGSSKSCEKASSFRCRAVLALSWLDSARSAAAFLLSRLSERMLAASDIGLTTGAAAIFLLPEENCCRDAEPFGGLTLLAL